MECDFNDPVLAHAATRARGPALCSFLIALAAFQRGLKVVFHRNTLGQDEHSDYFSGFLINGSQGLVFSVDDGTRYALFNRTLGPLTSKAASRIADDKYATRHCLQAAGIRVPSGLSFNRGDQAAVRRFIETSNREWFVVKPRFGSLSIGAFVRVDATEALRIANDHTHEQLLIEEYISGHELRLQVVDKKCLSALLRDPAHVIGDGTSTILKLIELKNIRRAKNPRFFLNTLNIDDDKKSFLAAQNLSPSDVPASGEKIYLSSLKNRSLGADFRECIGGANDSLKQVAVACCTALGLPNAGVDAVVSDNPDDPGVYVLEANQRPFIGSSSFPSVGTWRGNAIAEALMDHYFPATQDRARYPRFPNASFDMQIISDALQSTQCAKISLPTLSEGWKHFRSHLPANPNRSLIFRDLVLSGAQMWTLRLDNGEDIIDGMLPPKMQNNLSPQTAGLL